MQDHPSMIIEIRGHTDSVGEDDYNVYLSRKRAKAVVEFLKRKRYRKKPDPLRWLRRFRSNC